MSSKPQEEEQQQPFIQHLIELRSCLLRSVVCILIIFAALFGFANEIYDFVAKPLTDLLPEGSNMIAIGVATPFLAPFKLTLMCALFLSIPFIFYQIWSFIAPALYDNEKRLASPILFSSIALFYAGIAFAYFVVFPLVFAFFTAIGPSSVSMMTDISSYLSFVIKLFLAFGFAFEIPVATVILISAGVLSAKSLAEKRPLCGYSLLRHGNVPDATRCYLPGFARYPYVDAI